MSMMSNHRLKNGGILDGYGRNEEITPKSSVNVEDYQFIRSFQVGNDDLDDEDARLDLSCARSYDFSISEGGVANRVCVPCEEKDGYILDDSLECLDETGLMRISDGLGVRTMTIDDNGGRRQATGDLALANSHRGIGVKKKRCSMSVSTLSPSSGPESGLSQNSREMRESRIRDSDNVNKNGTTTSRNARSRQRRSFFRAMAACDESVPGMNRTVSSVRRGASKGNVASVLQRVAASAMSSRLVSRTRKAGVIDLTVSLTDGLCMVREILERDYRGMVHVYGQGEIRMQIVVSFYGKLSICNVLISGESKAFGCRLLVRRTVADSLRGGNEEFDKFTLTLHQQLVVLSKECEER